MIYITTGTTKYDFSRLFTNLENALYDLKSHEKTIIQVNNTKYVPKKKNIKIINTLAYNKNIQTLRRSRLTICHGGISSIILAIKHCKNKAIIVPRYSKFEEHINNHQVDFCKVLTKKYPVHLLLASKNFQAKLQHLIIHTQTNPLHNQQSNPNLKVINILNDFCSQLSIN